MLTRVTRFDIATVRRVVLGRRFLENAEAAMNYHIAKPSDSADIVRLLANVFSESDPPAVAMGLSVGEMEQFLQLLVPKVIPYGLTVVSRSKETGKLAGAFLTDDFASPPALQFSQINSKFRPIFSMLEILDAQFRSRRTISVGEGLHLFMLGVDRQFAGRGVGNALVKTCVDNGCKKGYRIAVTEATGRVSQHIFRKNSFVERFSVSYREFVHENKLVFASIKQHEKAILMDRSLV